MKLQWVWRLALLACLIGLAYGGSLRNDFVHDDTMFMEDPRVQSLGEMQRLLWEPRWGFDGDRDSGRIYQYYRPLEPLPYVASHFVGQGRPEVSHLLSLAFHLLNALLVLALLRRSIGAGWASAWGAALFAVHPAYSEAVLWPAALGGLGVFACTWTVFHLNVGPPWRWWAWPVSALLYFGALLFKETGVLAPAFVLLGWFFLDRRQTSIGSILGKLSAFAPALVTYALMRDGALGGAVPRLDHLPFTRVEMLLNGLALVPDYVATLVWPYPLSFHHDFDPVRSAWSISAGVGVVCVGLAGAVVVRTSRSLPALAFGVAAAVVAALPYLILHKPADNVFAERYLYDLGPGFVLCLASLVSAVSKHGAPAVRAGTIGMCVILLLVCVGLDRGRTAEWSDEVRLFRQTLVASSRAEIIRVNLGVRLLRQQRYSEGIAVLEELMAFAPDYRGAAYNLGLLYLGAGRVEDAVGALERARRLAPSDQLALLNLAYVYDVAGRREDSVATYFHLLRLAPKHSAAWFNLGIIALEEGQQRNVEKAVSVVLETNPDDIAAKDLLRRSRSAPPPPDRLPQVTRRRCESARIEGEAGRFRRAIAQLQAAAWLDEAAPLPHQYLANLYVMRGDRKAALVHQEEALKLAPNNELYRRNRDALMGQLEK